jgi:hypothetical protein
MDLAGQCLTNMSAAQQQQKQQQEEQHVAGHEGDQQQHREETGGPGAHFGGQEQHKKEQQPGRDKNCNGSATSSTSSNNSLSEVLVATLPLMLHYCCSILANLTQQGSGRIALLHQPASLQVLLQVLHLNDEPSAVAALGVLCNYCLSFGPAACKMQRGTTAVAVDLTPPPPATAAAASRLQVHGSADAFGSVIGVEGLSKGGMEQQLLQQGMKRNRSIGGGLLKQGDDNAGPPSVCKPMGSQSGTTSAGGPGLASPASDTKSLLIEDSTSAINAGDGAGPNFPGAVVPQNSSTAPGQDVAGQKQPAGSGTGAEGGSGGSQPGDRLGELVGISDRNNSKEGLPPEIHGILSAAEPHLAFWANMGGTRVQHMATWLVNQQQGIRN